MTRQEILENAMKCVSGDRDEQYGKPENSFMTIAHLWNIYLNAADVNDGVSITIKFKDVAAMLALLKIARIATGVQKDDNWIDLAGYAACGGELDAISNCVNNVMEKITIGISNEKTASKCEECEFRSDLPYDYPDRIHGCTLRQCVQQQPEKT